MRNLALITLALALGLAGCKNVPAQFVMVGCQVDGVLQPIAAAELEKLVPGGGTLETLLVHPLVVKWCADHGGTPAAAPVSVVGR